MIEIFSNWWFILAFLAIYLIAIVFVGLNSGGTGASPKRRLFSYLLLVGLIAPIPFLVSLHGTIAGGFFFAIFCIYVASIYLASYFKQSYCFLFDGVASVTKFFFLPQRKEWLLFLGVAMIAVAVKQFYMVWDTTT